MTSATTSVAIRISTDSSQITSTTISNATSPAVATATAPVFTAMAAPNSPISAADLYDQAKDKAVSEIDALVDLGKSGGTPKITKEQITDYITQKVQALKVSAKNQHNLPSVRTDLCKLTSINEIYYGELKEEILDLLIYFLETDPITQHSGKGIHDTIIALNANLAAPQAQKLTIGLQYKLSRAFSAAVELFLRHYNKKHFGAITEEQKKALLDAQSSFAGLNTHEDATLEFASEMALEASKRLTSDSTLFNEVLQRLTHFAIALGSAYDSDISNFLSEITQVFKGLDTKIKDKWFEALFVLRDLVQNAKEEKKKILAIQSTLNIKKKEYDWKFMYGALEMLSEVVSRSKDVKMIELALLGQSSLPGVAELLDFKGYVEKARMATSNDKKADNAIREKAKELCKAFVKQLSKIYEGRKLLIECHLFAKSGHKKELVEILEEVVPGDSKRQHDWLGTKDNKPQLPPTPTHVALKKPALPPLPPTPKSITASAAHSTTDVKIRSMSPTSQKDKKEASSTMDVKTRASSVQNESKEKHEKEAPKSEFHKAILSGQVDVVRKLLSQNKGLANEKDAKGNSSLIFAANKGSLEICEELIKAGAHSITRGEKFRNVLHVSAAAGHANIVKLFAADKLLLDSVDENNQSALMIATEQGHAEACAVLLEMLAKHNVQNAKGQNLVQIAASKGRARVISLFIEKLVKTNKVSLDAQDKEGNTALNLAAVEGHVEVCNLLVAAEANQLLTDLEGRSVLHAAVKSQKFELVQLFSKNKELWNAKYKEENVPSMTPLMAAAEAGLTDICEFLLSIGVDPAITDKDNGNALHFAAFKGHLGVVRLLATNKELVNSKAIAGVTSLLLAAVAGNSEICEFLLKAGADPLVCSAADSIKIPGNSNVLHFAACLGKNEIINMFIANKQLLNAKDLMGVTPLMYAALNGHSDTFEILFKAGADPLISSESLSNAMHFAAKSGKTSMIELLLGHRRLIDSADSDGLTPLMAAALEGHTKVCEILLKAGADPLVISGEKLFRINAMHVAASNGHLEVVKLLLPHKKLLNSQSLSKDTPLMLAALSGKVNVCEILLKSGADPLVESESGFNALHCAAKSGKKELVTLLLAHKKLINEENNEGETPFLIAAKGGHAEVCEILLKAKANPFAQDNQGGNAMSWAVENNYVELVHLLITPYSSKKESYEDYTMKWQTHYLLRAAELGYGEICGILLNAGGNPLEGTYGNLNSMHKAASNGKIEVIKILSKNPQTINSKDSRLCTPLLLAALNGHADACEVLIKLGADPLAFDCERSTAMHLAVQFGKTNVVEKLVSHKKLINSQTSQGFTPLMRVAEIGSMEIGVILLKAGADPLLVQEGGMNAMHIAAANGKVEIVKLFSDNKTLINAKDKGGTTPLMLAAVNGRKDVCEVLLGIGADPYSVQENDQNVMHFAAAYGHPEIVKMFLTDKKLLDSRNKWGMTPLMLAAMNGQTPVCEILLKGGADSLLVDVNGFNAMHLAAQKGLTEVVKLFASNKKTIDAQIKQGNTPLTLAAEYGSLECCEILLKAGADATIVTSLGMNALHFAVNVSILNSNLYDRLGLVNLLVPYKKLINTKTLKQVTPLMLAATGLEGFCSVEICEMLLKAGADPKQVDENGDTALHWAATNARTGVVGFLAKNPQLVNTANKLGMTPLMILAAAGNRDGCKALLEAGADPKLKDKDKVGKDALTMAKEKGHSEAADVISAYTKWSFLS